MAEREGSRSRTSWSCVLLLWKYLGETGKISWQAISMAALIQEWLFEALGIEDEEKRLINAKVDYICKPGFYEKKNKNDLTFKLAIRCVEIEGSAIRQTQLKSP